ncbi:MAG: HI0074 family nucleotidyltransferase substrate-binding subunit [Clostridia bacterium]
MKKIENFSRCLGVLRTCDPQLLKKDQLYRMGVIGQYSLSFELGWKALQAVLVLHGVAEAETGSPREILKQGYRVGFLNDEDLWLEMLKKRNVATHVYNEAEADELSELILHTYLPALERMRDTLEIKASEAENT